MGNRVEIEDSKISWPNSSLKLGADTSNLISHYIELI